VYGVLPSKEIDHINGDPGDNRIANLRLATRRENMANARRHKNNRSGLKGAYYNIHRGKWYSSIRGQFLGYVATKQEAHAAYCDAARERFGEFFNPGSAQ
jgi:hypothetical protein